MKPRAFFHAACLLLFTTAVGFKFQQPAPDAKEPKAEDVYKNIVIFKGMPASVVKPAMDGITAALGVKCDFCHVQDAKGMFQFEKDEKEEKNTARAMFTMMNKINADNFGGRMEVTCATCHQGRPGPNRIPPIGQAPVESNTNATVITAPKADDLVAKYVAAIGGVDAVDKVKSLSIKGNVASSDFNATMEQYAKAPDKVLATYTFKQGVFTQGFDGTTGWQSFGGHTQQIQGTELATFKASSPLFYVNPKLGYSAFRRVRPDTLNGKDVYVADVQGDPSAPMRIRLYFDGSSGLLSRVWYGTQTVVGIVPSTEDYSNYKDVDGVKMPFTIVDTSGDGVRTITLTEVKANASIDDSKFAMPR